MKPFDYMPARRENSGRDDFGGPFSMGDAILNPELTEPIPERLRVLRNLIDRGLYRVDSGQLAQKLMDGMIARGSGGQTPIESRRYPAGPVQ